MEEFFQLSILGVKTKEKYPLSREILLKILRSGTDSYEQTGQTRPRGYKKNFMLSSTEHEIFPAYKC